jgi:hypothetical protein
MSVIEPETLCMLEKFDHCYTTEVVNKKYKDSFFCIKKEMLKYSHNIVRCLIYMLLGYTYLATSKRPQTKVHKEKWRQIR